MTKLNQANVPENTKREFLSLIRSGFQLGHDNDYWTAGKCEESSNLLKKRELEDFIPDTSEAPVYQEKAFHTLIGEYNLYHYDGRLGDLEVRWAIGTALHQKQMKVWVHKVYF